MTVNPSRAMLGRLRGIDWSDDSQAFTHANSRALLMREYLRRAALWATEYRAERSWPFFDVVEHVDADIRTPPDIAAELEEILTGLSPSSLRTTCRGAVRWAELKGIHGGSPVDLPDPYEPLLLMYERGGGYFLEEYVDLNGVMIRLGNVHSNAAATPFLTLAPTTLDALDANGEIEYYAEVSSDRSQAGPRGIVRRRVDGDQQYDEAFTRSLRWEPTDQLQLWERQELGSAFTQVGDIEAAHIIEATARSAPTDDTRRQPRP